MNQMRCGYEGDREGLLIAYLYDDVEPSSRAEFEAHLAVCEPCQTELEALSGVRTTLSRWNPPEPKWLAGESNRQSTINSQQSRWWQEVPAWAQVAAALLFLGVSAGVANLDVRHDGSGWTIRTGWMTPPAQGAVAATTARRPEQIGVASQPADAAFTPASTADLAALERRLRDELRPQAAMSAMSAMSAVSAQTPVRSAASDTEILRKVWARIEETERRQERELALRLAQAINDVNAQRQAD